MERKKISKNFYLGNKITNPREILNLSKEGKTVYVTVWKRHSPAAFFVAWQLRQVYIFIDKGYLYNVIKINKDE